MLQIRTLAMVLSVTGMAVACSGYSNADAPHESTQDCEVLEGTYKIQNGQDLQVFSDRNCVEVTGDVLIENAGGLTHIDELKSVQRVGGDVHIRYNEDLIDIDGLRVLSVGGNVVVSSNPSLVSGLSGLKRVVGELQVKGNDSLQDIEFSSLEEVGGLRLISNPELAITRFPKLSSVSERFFIRNNASLQGLELAQPLEVGGTLILNHNKLLSDIQALEGITSLKELRIYRNPELTNLEGLHNLETVMGDLVIGSSAGNSEPVGRFPVTGYADEGVASLNGLRSLRRVALDLEINASKDLTNLHGLESLQEVGGNLHLLGNGALTNTDGPTSLEQIAGNLVIANNKVLTSVHGLVSVRSLGGDLTVADNPSLPECEAFWLRDEIASRDIGGEISIYGNDDTASCD